MDTGRFERARETTGPEDLCVLLIPTLPARPTWGGQASKSQGKLKEGVEKPAHEPGAAYVRRAGTSKDRARIR